MGRRKDHVDPTPLRGLLSPAAAGYGLDDALSAGMLWKRWLDVVGHDVAAHAEPTSLRGGVLRVRADSPVWAHEIGYLADEIKKRANVMLGRDAVVEVKVWNAPGPPATASASTSSRTLRAAVEESREDLELDPLNALERARSAWSTRRHRGAR